MDESASATRILIADDYIDLAEMLSELLAVACPFPIEVEIVPDGGAALDRALANPPHCVLLDINMPIRDGLSVANAIREKLGPNSPMLVAITGDPRNAETPGRVQAFDHFMMKPADIDTLVEIVAMARTRG